MMEADIIYEVPEELHHRKALLQNPNGNQEGTED